MLPVFLYGSILPFHTAFIKATLVFPFHYGQEAESYSFYRIPKILFKAKSFDRLSTDAKLFYGILLDRMQLSIRNGWVDDEGKVYIYFRRQKVMEELDCCQKKAGQLMAELDDKNGIGLITRIHQGLGKPDRIYVHRCTLPQMEIRGSPGDDRDGPDSSAGQVDPAGLTDEGACGDSMPSPDVSEIHVQRCKKYPSKRPKEKLVNGLAEALGVSPEAIRVPDIDSFTGLMHTLFAIEDMYGLTILTSHGKPCLSMVGSAVPQQEGLSQYLQEWCDVKMDLLHGRISKTQYDDWRYNYPRLKREKKENEITYTPLESVIEEPASAS